MCVCVMINNEIMNRTGFQQNIYYSIFHGYSGSFNRNETRPSTFLALFYRQEYFSSNKEMKKHSRENPLSYQARFSLCCAHVMK